MRLRALIGAVFGALMTFSAGCSDDVSSGTSAPASSTSNGVVATTAVIETEPSTDPAQTTTLPTVPSLTAVPSLEGEVGALADSATTTCASDAGGWTAAGTVTNPTDTIVDYLVIVSFLNADGGTLGADFRDVKAVNPGGSGDWSVSMPVTGTDLRCVLRVTRAPSP